MGLLGARWDVGYGGGSRVSVRAPEDELELGACKARQYAKLPQVLPCDPPAPERLLFNHIYTKTSLPPVQSLNRSNRHGTTE